MDASASKKRILISISRGFRDLVGGTITSSELETWPVPFRRRP
jgi:hypothetical protein